MSLSQVTYEQLLSVNMIHCRLRNVQMVACQVRSHGMRHGCQFVKKRSAPR